VVPVDVERDRTVRGRCREANEQNQEEEDPHPLGLYYARRLSSIPT
jgi:hypothetical protein